MYGDVDCNQADVTYSHLRSGLCTRYEVGEAEQDVGQQNGADFVESFHYFAKPRHKCPTMPDVEQHSH